MGWFYGVLVVFVLCIVCRVIVICSELKCQFFTGPTKEPKCPRGARVEKCWEATSRLRRLNRRALAASEQRRREADTARLERVAKIPPPGAMSARFSPFRAGSPPEPLPRSRSEARPFSVLGCRSHARAPQSVGHHEYVEVWRTDDDIRLAMTVRVLAPQIYSRRAGSWPRRPSLHAHLMARQCWRERDKAWRGGAPAL